MDTAPAADVISSRVNTTTAAEQERTDVYNRRFSTGNRAIFGQRQRAEPGHPHAEHRRSRRHRRDVHQRPHRGKYRLSHHVDEYRL